MEKNTEQYNYYKLLSQELILEILPYCDNSTFAKISYLAAKEVQGQIHAAITTSIHQIFQQPSIAWKTLNKTNIQKAINILQEEVHITALLKRINEWIETKEGAKKFNVWIKVFGQSYIERYAPKGNEFESKEHQALYCLVTGNIKNVTERLFTLLNEEQLKETYPSVVKSLKKSYLLISLSKKLDDHTAVKALIKELKQLDEDDITNLIFFFNSLGIDHVGKIFNM